MKGGFEMNNLSNDYFALNANEWQSFCNTINHTDAHCQQLFDDLLSQAHELVTLQYGDGIISVESQLLDELAILNSLKETGEGFAASGSDEQTRSFAINCEIPFATDFFVARSVQWNTTADSLRTVTFSLSQKQSRKVINNIQELYKVSSSKFVA